MPLEKFPQSQPTKLRVIPASRRLGEIFSFRGWQVFVEKASRANVIPVKPHSVLNCSDGRNPDLGPKLFGGLWGVMALATGGDRSGYRQAVAWIANAGFEAGIHGDDTYGEFACGFFNLWRSNRLTGVYPCQLDDEDRFAVVSRVHEMKAHGQHEEKILVVNLVPNMTPIPARSQFSVDAWLAPFLGIDFNRLAKVSAQTVEQLTPVRTLKIIQP